MRLASYRTEHGAAKYAAEIARKFPSVKTQTVANPRDPFRWGVMILTGDGKTAYAGKRPRNYAAPQVFTIPNNGGL